MRSHPWWGWCDAPSARIAPQAVIAASRSIALSEFHPALSLRYRNPARQSTTDRIPGWHARDMRRHEDEIAGTGFGGELQLLAPAHPGLALHHIDDAFEMAVMVRPGLGVGPDRHGAGRSEERRVG